jgi:hypothetical protein
MNLWYDFTMELIYTMNSQPTKNPLADELRLLANLSARHIALWAWIQS